MSCCRGKGLYTCPSKGTDTRIALQALSLIHVGAGLAPKRATQTPVMKKQMAMVQNHFGIPFWDRCSTHSSRHFSGDWDVDWGYGVLTHTQMHQSNCHPSSSSKARSSPPSPFALLTQLLTPQDQLISRASRQLTPPAARPTRPNPIRGRSRETPPGPT